MDNALAPTDHGQVTAQPSTRRPISSRAADPTDLEPVDRLEFAEEITPALALVAPVGMSEHERKTWFRAAFLALDGIPIGLLRRGVREAMSVADHHAKIVPAIRKAIDEDWRWRRDHARRTRPAPTLPAPEETAEERENRIEVAQLAGKLARAWQAKHPV